MEEEANALPNSNTWGISGLAEAAGICIGRSSPLVVVLGHELQIFDLTGNFALEVGIG
jgi:hypothetical protein